MAQTTSELWKSLMMMKNTQKEYAFEIDGVWYGPEAEVEHSSETMLFSEFGFGNAPIGTLSLSLYADNIPRGAQIKRFVRLVNGDQQSEWMPKGVFWANRRAEDGGLWTIEAFDGMRKAEKEWEPGESADIIPTINFTTNSLGIYMETYTTAGARLTIGETYVVWFDGAPYVCECYRTSSTLPNGLTAYFGTLGSEETGEPFLITESPGGATIPGLTIECDVGKHSLYITTTNDFPMTMALAVEKLAALMGVEIDDTTQGILSTTYTVDYPTTHQTIRQTLAWIAAAHGGNFIMSDSGKLRLIPLLSAPAETNYLIDEHGRAITIGGVRILV